MPKPLTVWIIINCGKYLKEMGIPDHLTCLLRNLYAGQETTVRTGLGTTDWFQIEKGVHQGCILLPCLFNLYAEYIMRNTRRHTIWNQVCQEKYKSPQICRWHHPHGRRCSRPRFNPWVRKISWRRQWQPTPVFLPGKSHGRRSLISCSPWDRWVRYD